MNLRKQERSLRFSLLLAGAALLAAPHVASAWEGEMTEVESQATALLQTYVAQYKPLSITANLAWWEASISGKDEDFQKRKDAENKLARTVQPIQLPTPSTALRPRTALCPRK